MVLAAGLGTRMRPLTLLRAKPVLPVLNRPLLHWTLELLAAHGVRDVIVNLHHRPETVKAALGDGRRLGVRVRYAFEPVILGTAGGPREVLSRLGDEPFLLVNGDVAFDFDLTALVERHRATGARATLGLLPNPDPAYYNPVTLVRGRVRAIGGQPASSPGPAMLFAGVHVVDPGVLRGRPRGVADMVRDVYLPMLAVGEPVHGFRLRGPWHDMGSPRHYLDSHRALLGRGFRGAPRGVAVHPSADVAAEARVRTSAVGERSEVAGGAVVSGSVLWDEVQVGEGATVEDSVLGSGVRVLAGETLRGVVAVVRGGRRRLSPVAA